jgi:hypothetical protein
MERNHPPIQNLRILTLPPGPQNPTHVTTPLPHQKTPGWKPGNTAAKMAAATGQCANAPIQNLRLKKDFHSSRKTSMFCCIQSL